MAPGLTIEDIEAHIGAEQTQADECRARCNYLQKAIACAEAEAMQHRNRIANAENSSAGGGSSSQDVQQILRCILEVMQPMREQLMAKAAANALSDQESIAYVALTGWNQKASSSTSKEKREKSSTPAHRRQVRSLSPPTVSSAPVSQCPTPQPYPQVLRKESSASQQVPIDIDSTVHQREHWNLQPMAAELQNGIVADVKMPNSEGPAATSTSHSGSHDGQAVADEWKEAPVRQGNAKDNDLLQVNLPPAAMPDDMPELKVKRQQKKQQSRQVPTPMAQLKKQLDQDMEARTTDSLYSEQPRQLDQREAKEFQVPWHSAEEQPGSAAKTLLPQEVPQENAAGSAAKASLSQTAVKARAQMIREKMLAKRRERRLSEELPESPAMAGRSEVPASDEGTADEALADKDAAIKQQRRQSLKLVRQQWQEKQKKKQQEIRQEQQDTSETPLMIQEKAQQAGFDNEDVHEEPQSHMAKVMQEYKSSQEQDVTRLEVDGPPASLSERRNSKNTLANKEQGVLGQHVGQWAEQKQKLLQHEDEVRKRWEGLDELLPKGIQSEETRRSQTKSNASARLSLQPYQMPLSKIVGTYSSEDCDSVTVKSNGAVFFDVEDMGVVVAHAPDGTPLLRPHGKESALASELDYAFRLLTSSDTDLVWRDEVDSSAPYVRWKKSFGSEMR
eukprot:gnl/MRDRNA2_/MRDRNA2_92788_c0_seq1.p1 gnl/MRDRNA2_/MRDRNA2_92788_c0~~gnl/MRDRNA2_/MRDRNA2_92788_c0_seq1.p1  ORF type:complete len:734 (+),score=189.66 gnl/MRDRNA2_/MRDRNA2_92788_c0_seq1:180-2204(+)